MDMLYNTRASAFVNVGINGKTGQPRHSANLGKVSELKAALVSRNDDDTVYLNFNPDSAKAYEKGDRKWTSYIANLNFWTPKSE